MNSMDNNNDMMMSMDMPTSSSSDSMIVSDDKMDLSLNQFQCLGFRISIMHK